MAWTLIIRCHVSFQTFYLILNLDCFIFKQALALNFRKWAL